MNNYPTNNHSREYNISNENLLLIGILNSMYNDNIRQINNLSESIHLLNETNSEIRNLLTQILYTNTNRRNQFYRPTSSSLPNFRQHITAPSHMRSNVRRVTANTGLYDFLTNENDNHNDNHNDNDNDNDNDNHNQNDHLYRNRNTRTDTTRTNVNANRNTNVSQFWQNFFQPIAIFPTQTQIETATRTVQYGDIVSPMNRACPISLENFNDTDIVSVIRFCSHIFNRDELNTWFRTNCRCPVCRYDIRNYQPNMNRDTTDHPSESREQSESENQDAPANNEEITQPLTTIRDGNAAPNSSIVFDFYFDNNIFRDISGNFGTNNTSDVSLISSLLNNALNNSRGFR